MTGATSGIGRAIAVRLGQARARLCLVGRDAARLEAVSEIVSSRDRCAVVVRRDLADPKAPAAIARAVEAEFGRLDILVHAAGMICYAPFDEARVSDFERQLAVNVLAPYALTQRLLALLCASKGQVVFINSLIVLQPSVATIQYAATKHALKGVADGVRKELNPRGVRVMSVYPGRTATPMQEGLCRIESREYRPAALLQPDAVAEVVCNALNLPRTVEVTDIHVRPAIKP